MDVGALQQGWCVPQFEQIYRIALPDSEQQANIQRTRRPKSCCFNCGSGDHPVAHCPVKLDQERIRRNREHFQEQIAESMGLSDPSMLNGGHHNNSGSGLPHDTSRYHEDSYQTSLMPDMIIDERFRQFKPGVISLELRRALGLKEQQLPIYIYNMRKCGYPPGWLREARVKKSGLQVFHDNEEGEIVENNSKQQQSPTVSDDQRNSHLSFTIEQPFNQSSNGLDADNSFEYDIDKVISYSGYNSTIPEGFVDESDHFNLPQYNSSQSKENMIKEAYLVKKPSLKRKASFGGEALKPVEQQDKKFKLADETFSPLETTTPLDSQNDTIDTQPMNETFGLPSAFSYEQRSLSHVYGTPLLNYPTEGVEKYQLPTL
ncbi:unnamed protein product, partial [Didymodactylos carnosus]